MGWCCGSCPGGASISYKCGRSIGGGCHATGGYRRSCATEDAHPQSKFCISKSKTDLRFNSTIKNKPKNISIMNQCENCYRQTDPWAIKHKYRTSPGMLAYLARKMEYWTAKFGQVLEHHVMRHRPSGDTLMYHEHHTYCYYNDHEKGSYGGE